MLRFEDRMRIALGANMGFQVQPSEVEDVARMLVVLRQIRDACKSSSDRGGNLGSLVDSALKPFEDEKIRERRRMERSR